MDNPHLRGFSAENLRWMATAFWLGHWHPLTWLSLALDRAIHGADPWGFHLTNLALHAWNAAAVFLLLDALLERAAPANAAGRAWAAALGALFFAIHPLRVESVAWITERRDVLCGAFLFPAVWLWIRSTALAGATAATGATERAARARRRLLLLSVASFALSLLCKAWGVTLPAVLLALDAWALGRWTRASGVRRALLIEKLPYAVLALAVAALAPLAQSRTAEMPTLAEHTPLERLLQACYALFLYVRKTLAPIGLHPAYLLPQEIGAHEARFAVALAAVAAITVGLWAVRRRWPFVWCAWLVHALVAAPTLGFFQSGLQLAADRYTYVAGVAWSALVAGAALRWLPNAAARAGAAALVLVPLAVATQRQSELWSDAERLWTHALRSDPRNYLALTCRATVRLERGDASGAASDLDLAISAHPDWAGAYARRALVRRRGGDAAGALQDYDRALGIDARDVRVRNRRAELRASQGDLAGAVADYSVVLDLDPDDYEAWGGRGNASLLLGAHARAADDLARALALAPADWSYRPAMERLLQRARAGP